MFECEEILNLTVTRRMHGHDTLGDGAMCIWTSASTLKVTFGTGTTPPTVVPGDVLHLRDNVLSADVPSMLAFNQSIAILGPDTPTVPVITLNAPTAVGVCDNIKLDASATSGSGGRRMAFNYSLVECVGGGCANVTASLNEANAANGGYGAHTVTIPSSAMPKGTKMVFRLHVSNFLGEASSKEVMATKLSYPAPIVSIQGANPREISYSDELVLRVDAALPEMSCISDSLSDAKMNYVWSETTGKYTGSLSTTNPRILRIASEQLQATESYEFQCFVTLTSNTDNNNTAFVIVDVKQQPIITKIAGGKERTSGTEQELVLDAGVSVDPDDMSGAWSYVWTCENKTDGTVCVESDGTTPLALSPNSTNAIARVPANTISAGAYVFTVLVKKDDRNDTATTTVVVSAGSPPVVSIATLSKAKYNPIADNFVQLVGAAVSDLGIVGTASSLLALHASWARHTRSLLKEHSS